MRQSAALTLKLKLACLVLANVHAFRGEALVRTPSPVRFDESSGIRHASVARIAVIMAFAT